MEAAGHSRYIRDKFYISYILIFCKKISPDFANMAEL